MNNEKFEILMGEAVEMVEAGFVSKAGQKRALALCTSMMDMICAEFSGAYLDLYNYEERDLPENQAACDLYYAQPNTATFAKYLVKAETAVGRMDKEVVNSLIALGEQVVALIATIKTAEIKTPEPKVSAREIAVKESIMDLMNRRGEQYNRCLRLDEMFGTMGITANVHIVHGHKGTVFLRAFYYILGHLTPLNVIIAAIEEAEKRKK